MVLPVWLLCQSAQAEELPPPSTESAKKADADPVVESSKPGVEVLKTPAELREILGRAHFVVAYFLGEATDAEKRPIAKDSSSYHPEDGEDGTEYVPYGVIEFGSKLDIAALAGLSRERARLSDAQRETLLKAVFDPHEEALIRECYNPHHIFVFYDRAGQPVGAIEVCLSCRGVDCLPRIESEGVLLHHVDFLAIATLLNDLHLSLAPGSHALDLYRESLEKDEVELVKIRARRAEEKKAEEAQGK